MTSHAAKSMSPTLQVTSRIAFVDGLRGLACLSVMLFHLYWGGPLRHALSEATRGAIDGLVSHGWLGVQVFFVISGFVLAHSLGNDRVTASYIGRFILRRSIRLDPTYWATIGLVVAINAASNHVLHDRQVPLPALGQVLSHVAYVYPLVGHKEIVPVFWTLCHEVQFYLLFVLLLGATQQLSTDGSLQHRLRHGLLVLSGTASVFLMVYGVQVPGLCLTTWYMFCLGALCYDAVQRGAAGTVLLALGAASVLCGWRGDWPALASVVTAASLVLGAQLGRLDQWLCGWTWQYLGRISYSLYLVHVVIGGRVINLGFRLTENTPQWAVVWLFAACVASIVAAQALYVCVERPSLLLAKRLRRNGHAKQINDKTPANDSRPLGAAA